MATKQEVQDNIYEAIDQAVTREDLETKADHEMCIEGWWIQPEPLDEFYDEFHSALMAEYPPTHAAFRTAMDAELSEKQKTIGSDRPVTPPCV